MAVPTFPTGTFKPQLMIETSGASNVRDLFTKQVDDLMMLVIFQDGTGTNPTVGARDVGVSGTFESLSGTTDAFTPLTGNPFTVGNPAAGKLHIFFARCTNASQAGVSVNTPADDIFCVIVGVRGIDPAATTIADIIESISSGAGTLITIADAGVTTTGPDRLAVNIIGVNDDNAVPDFTGESGGNWAKPFLNTGGTEAAEWASATGTDGAIAIQTAAMPSAGTINGGTCDMAASDAWGVVGFAFKPAASATPIVASDSGSGSEISLLTAAQPTTETGTGADVVIETALSAVVESGAGSDVALVSVPKAAVDSGVGTEISIVSVPKIVTESGAGADNVVGQAQYVLTDTGAGADSVAETVPYAVTDVGAGVDAILALVAGLPVSDVGTGADVAQIAAALATLDAVVGVETSILVTILAAIDSGSGADVSSVDMGAGDLFKTASDSGTGADISLLTAGLSAADIGAGADVAALTFLLARTETGAGLEVSSLAVQVTRVEAGVGSDAAAISALISSLDTGAGTEAALHLVLLSAQDTGSGADAGTVGVGTEMKFGSDTGSGADVSTLIAALTATEVSGSTETTAIIATLASADVALLVDSVEVLAAILATDAMIGTEDAYVSIGQPGVPITGVIIRRDPVSGAVIVSRPLQGSKLVEGRVSATITRAENP